MVNYVEQATLKIQDKSSKTIRKINQELRDLFRTAERASRIRITFQGLDTSQRNVRQLRAELQSLNSAKAVPRVGIAGIASAVAEAERFRAVLARLPNTETSRINVASVVESVNRAKRLRSAIVAIPTSRTVRLNVNRGNTLRQVTDLRNAVARWDGMSVSVPVTMPGLTASLREARSLQAVINSLNGRRVNVPVATPGFAPRTGANDPSMSWGNNMARGFTNALSPQAIGGNIARGMTYALSGELYQLGRQTVLAAAAAPLNIEDARQLFQATGRSKEETSFVEDIAGQMSQQFSGSSQADILASAREVLGTIEGDLRDFPEFVGKALERVARNATVLGAAGGLTGAEAGEQARLLEKAIGIVGARSDAELAAEFSNAVTQGVIASGGDLSVGEAVRALQQLGAMRSDLSPEAFLQTLLNRDEGGRRGTGEIRQAYEDMIRGNLNKEDLATQIRAGIRDKDGRSLIADDFSRDMLGSVEKEIIPRLEKLGVNISDATAVREALDNDLGFSKQGGITALTDFIVNFEERVAEFNRAQRVTPETFVEDPTTRQRAGQVASQFENFAAGALEGILPIVEGTLNTLQGSLSAVAEGEGGLIDYAALASAAVPAGVVAALQGLSDPDTAPLAAAGLSLTGSAGALSTAAAALSAAALLRGGKPTTAGTKVPTSAKAAATGSLASSTVRGVISKMSGPATVGASIGALYKFFSDTPIAEREQTYINVLETVKGAMESFGVEVTGINATMVDLEANQKRRNMVDPMEGAATTMVPVAEPVVMGEPIQVEIPDPVVVEPGPLSAPMTTPTNLGILGGTQSSAEIENYLAMSGEEVTRAFTPGALSISEASAGLASGSQVLSGVGGELAGAAASLAGSAAALSAAAGALANAGGARAAAQSRSQPAFNTGSNNPQ